MPRALYEPEKTASSAFKSEVSMKVHLREPIQLKDIVKQWQDLITEWHGDEHLSVSTICTPESPDSESLCFAHSTKALSAVSDAALAILVLPENAANSPQNWKAQALIYSTNPEWLKAEMFHQHVLPTPFRPTSWSGVHPTAVIHAEAQLAADVQVGPYAVIGARVRIGAKSYIGAHTVVEEDAQLGNEVTLHPHVYLGHHCVLGNEVEVQSHTTIGCEGFGYTHNRKGEHRRIPHLGKVVIEDQVHIGASCTIDRGTMGDTIIRTGTRMDNQCHIAHNCEIGRHSLITAQFAMAGSSRVGNHFICGGRTAINGHISVTDGVNVAAFSGVLQPVDKPGQYGGYPLQPLQDYLKTRSLSTRLPEMRRQILDLKQKVENLLKASEK